MGAQASVPTEQAIEEEREEAPPKFNIRVGLVERLRTRFRFARASTLFDPSSIHTVFRPGNGKTRAIEADIDRSTRTTSFICSSDISRSVGQAQRTSTSTSKEGRGTGIAWIAGRTCASKSVGEESSRGILVDQT